MAMSMCVSLYFTFAKFIGKQFCGKWCRKHYLLPSSIHLFIPFFYASIHLSVWLLYVHCENFLSKKCINFLFLIRKLVNKEDKSHASCAAEDPTLDPQPAPKKAQPIVDWNIQENDVVEKNSFAVLISSREILLIKNTFFDHQQVWQTV